MEKWIKLPPEVDRSVALNLYAIVQAADPGKATELADEISDVLAKRDVNLATAIYALAASSSLAVHQMSKAIDEVDDPVEKLDAAAIIFMALLREFLGELAKKTEND